jgi:predicted ATP-binding protein involved in virulence
LEWQVKIIPTLKKLFPNTTFFIATHSPLVLSQLEDGEAYELRRDEDDVVRTHKIKNPGNTAMIDLLKTAFNIDLNRLALDRPISATQQKARTALLERMKSRRVAQ